MNRAIAWLMDTEQLIHLVLTGLNTFAAFVVLVVTTVVVFVLWRRKEGGALGAFVLMLARTGVWLFWVGLLITTSFAREIGVELYYWVYLGLRGFLVLSTLVMIPAFLLIKTKEA